VPKNKKQENGKKPAKIKRKKGVINEKCWTIAWFAYSD